LLFLIVAIFYIPGCSNLNAADLEDKTEAEKEDNLSNEHNNDNRGLANDELNRPQEDSTKEQVLDEVAKQISEMSIEEKVGQMVFTGIEGTIIDGNTAELIERYKIGGIILLGENIINVSQAQELLNSLKALNKKNGNIPLFLGVDQEGGRVNRMPKDYAKIPAAKEIGKINNREFAYEVGNLLGIQVKSLGFNLDFAPVLDVNSNPKNTVIGNRAFGSDSNIVSELGIQTMKGISSQGIIPVIKHFPGHGNTSVDSHTGLPVENADIKRLKDFETIPYDNAIKNGAEMVMVAHILFPKIDPDNPSSLSKSIITDLLKKYLEFDGLVITDDMTMGAIIDNYNIGEAAVKSVNAGSDIILVCHDYSKEKLALEALADAVKRGSIDENSVDRSVYKIIKLKEKYRIEDENTANADVNSINFKVKNILSKYMK